MITALPVSKFNSKNLQLYKYLYKLRNEFL